MTKNILITGSTDGIGKLAANKMAKAGHQLYLHGRNESKLETVISELKRTSGNDHIEGFVADFSDLNQVQQMAQDVEEKLLHLDVLINNAGVLKSPNTTAENGLDIRFVVNYLAPFLLTTRLMKILSKKSKARVINLSSAAQSPISSGIFDGTNRLSDQEAYAQSKLAILIWSFYLARKQSDVTVIALNPGSLLNTNMVREAYGRYWSSADKGADIIYELSLSPEYVNSSGKYFDNDIGRFGPAHEDAYNTDLIDSIIQKTNLTLKTFN